jgi:hypothetical protein
MMMQRNKVCWYNIVLVEGINHDESSTTAP